MRRHLVVLLCALFAVGGCTDDLTPQLEALERGGGPVATTTAKPKPAVATPTATASAVDQVVGALCKASSSGYGGVKPHVAQVGHYLQGKFDVATVYGVRAGSVADSDHPVGTALDLMVFSDRALGDRIVADVLAHWSLYGVKYVIWQRAIHEGGGWESMEDRGSATANHFDHVHISFVSSVPKQRDC